VTHARPPYRWSDPAIIAANRRGSFHPSQVAAFANRRIWLVFPLALLFAMLPCSACAWFGCDAPTDAFDPSGDTPTQWVCGNPTDIGNLPRWILMGVGCLLALGIGYALARYDRRYRARVFAGPISHSAGWVTFQATGAFMARRYVVHTMNLLALRVPPGREDLPPPGAYTLFYEPTTRLLLSAEPLSLPASEGEPWAGSASATTRQLIQQALAASFPFTADDLNRNRASALSESQEQVMRAQRREQALVSLGATLFVMAIVCALWFSGLDRWRIGALGGGDLVDGAIAGALLAVLGRIAWAARTRPSGQTVAVYEGRVERSRVGGGDSPTRYYYRCGSRRLKVSGDAYRALVADYTYRVYYAPRVGAALSAEALGPS
jgi:hypothetical protein